MQKLSAAMRLSLAFSLIAALSACGAAPDESGAAEEGPSGEATHALATLVLVNETKLSNLVNLSSSDYEASGVQLSGGYLYIVLDNTSKIAKVNTSLTSGSFVGGGTGETNYEGITLDTYGTQHLYVMKEMESDSDKRGKVLQLDTSANYKDTEWTDMTFTKKNKGFEGVAWLRWGSDDWLLGLCEGNYCTDDDVNVGNGRIKVMIQSGSGWDVQSTLNVPSSANFKDYSDIALLDNGDGTYRVAITSQESSKLWIGTLSTNTSPWSFTGTATVYDFPKTGSGKTQYCTVEGVTFLSATRIAVASDMDTSGSSACNSKDESVHVFDIP